MRPQRSRGASSTEYALLIAVLGGVLCLGVATVAKVVVGHSFCTLGQALGVDLCSGIGGPDGSAGPGGASDDVPAGGSSPTGAQSHPAPSSTPACARPTPSDSVTSPAPTPSPSCSTG